MIHRSLAELVIDLIENQNYEPEMLLKSLNDLSPLPPEEVEAVYEYFKRKSLLEK